MTTLQASVTEKVAARPDDLFERITDIGRLPEWNEHIHHVVEAPGRLGEGSEWVVEMRAMGSKWNSRSELAECDPAERRFAYVTRTDDGNPSRAYWTWVLSPVENGTQVTVKWELHPKTFWRKTLFARIRHRQLKNEVRTSIGAVAAAVAARPGA